MLTEVNNSWLNIELQQFDYNENLQQVAILFREKVKEALTSNLLKSTWKLEEFLSLSIAFNMAEEFCTTYNRQPSVDINQRALGEYYTYPLTHWNVCEIKQRLNQYYIHALALLKRVQKNRLIPIEVSPIEWLELVESMGEELFIPSAEKFLYEVIWSTAPEPGIYLPPKTLERIESSKRSPIVTTMAELIRFHHYGIDILIAKRGIFPVSRLSVDEAAKYLGISVNQIIEKCFEEENLGVYLKEGQFKVRKFLTTNSQCLTRSYIDEISKPSYLCRYKGLIRLEKNSKLYPDKTLEKIYEGSCIEVPHEDSYNIVPLQSSLAELVQGISQVIELRKGQKITIHDLIFIQPELTEYKKSDQLIIPCTSSEMMVKPKQSIDDKVHPKLLSDFKPMPLTPDSNLVAVTPNSVQLQIISVVSNQFSKNGTTYKIRYLDEQPFHLPVDKGLDRIAYLLIRPKQAVSIILLMQLSSQEEISTTSLENIEELHASGISLESEFNHHDVVITPAQLQQYKNEVSRINEEIEEAKEFGDTEKVEQLKQTLDFITNQIKAKTNRKGRPRVFNSQKNKAPVNSLRQSLTRSKQKIKKHSPELYEHLKKSIHFCLETATVVYNPQNENIWS